MPTSLTETLLKKGFWLYFFGFIIAPLWYIIKIIISQDLSVSEVWILYGIISLITLLSAFSDFWIRESLSYFIPQFTERKQEHHIKLLLVFWFVVQLVTGIIIFSLFFFGADIIAQNYFKSEVAIDILKVFSCFFLWINLFQLINSFFLAVQNTFLQKITEFIRMIFVVCGVVVIYFLDIGSLIQYSFAWIWWVYVGVVISTVIFYIYYYKQYISNTYLVYDVKVLKEIFVYASVTFFSVQSFFILSQIDMQMVLYMLGSVDAWYYTNYLSLVSIPNMILGPIFLLLYPVISELHAKQEYWQIHRIKSLFQKHFLVISLAFSTLFFIFSLPIATILFWEKFVMSGTILQFSILFVSWNFLLRINHIILAATGRAKTRLYIVLISIVVNIIANYLLIQTIGVAGAALGTWISWIIIWWLTEYVLKDHRISFDIPYIWRNVFFLVIIWVVMYFWALPIFASFSRFWDFVLLSSITITFFIMFFIYNKSEVYKFISEVRKLKN